MSESIKKVLIVDDDPIILQSFVDYFEDHLWQTLQAINVELALDLLEEESPDCAVVDIRLKGVYGEAFIREAHRQKPKMAFVICTGSPKYQIPDDLLKVPALSNHVYRKPVNDMAEVEKELLRLIKIIETKKD